MPGLMLALSVFLFGSSLGAPPQLANGAAATPPVTRDASQANDQSDDQDEQDDQDEVNDVADDEQEGDVDQPARQLAHKQLHHEQVRRLTYQHTASYRSEPPRRRVYFHQSYLRNAGPFHQKTYRRQRQYDYDSDKENQNENENEND